MLRGRRLAAAGAWAGLTLLAGAAGRPAHAADAPVRFDIPPQPLSGAIETFVAVSGVQVLYDRPPAGEPRSPGVVGSYAPDDALRILLRGAGLLPIFIHGDSVVLRSSAGPGAAGGPPAGLALLPLETLEVVGAPTIAIEAGDRLDTQLYAGLIREAVRESLLEDPLTASGRYRVGLKLWIGKQGEVRDMAQAKTTGEAALDQAIAAAVRRIVLDRAPPAGLPQPVTIVVNSAPAR